MNISKVFIRRPIAAALMTAGLFAFGAVCFTLLGATQRADRRCGDC
jgi:multidrug efflux pump subunit AcrB